MGSSSGSKETRTEHYMTQGLRQWALVWDLGKLSAGGLQERRPMPGVAVTESPFSVFALGRPLAVYGCPAAANLRQTCERSWWVVPWIPEITFEAVELDVWVTSEEGSRPSER